MTNNLITALKFVWVIAVVVAVVAVVGTADDVIGCAKVEGDAVVGTAAIAGESTLLLLLLLLLLVIFLIFLFSVTLLCTLLLFLSAFASDLRLRESLCCILLLTLWEGCIGCALSSSSSSSSFPAL